MDLEEFLSREFFGNTYQVYGTALLTILVGYILRRYIGRTFAKVFFRFFRKFSQTPLKPAKKAYESLSEGEKYQFIQSVNAVLSSSPDINKVRFAFDKEINDIVTGSQGSEVKNIVPALELFRQDMEKVAGLKEAELLRSSIIDPVVKEREKQMAEEFIGLLLRPFQVLILVASFYIAFLQLNYPESWEHTATNKPGAVMYINRIFALILILSITWFLLRIVDYIMLVLLERAQLTEDKSDDQIVLFLKDMIKVVVVIFALFFILSAVFKLNITSLIAGLGIGGLAIALAAQETLSNLLASFIIFLDKPFKAGDLVSFDNITGTIEKVGFRSTQVRTLDKSLLTVPNKSLIDGPLNNITLSPFRRVKFTLSLVYDTPSSSIKKIVDEISEVLRDHPETRDDFTVVFGDFSNYSLDITVVFFVLTNEWGHLMRVKQEINYRIMEIVESNGAAFAYPTQTIYMGDKKED